jgi:cystathionine beta-lyase
VSGSKHDQDQPFTRLVTGGRREAWTGAVVNPPVWRASTILFDSVAQLRAAVKRNQDGDFYYGRRGTPTQWSLADALTGLEPGAAGTMLYPSGVAAIAGALLSVIKPGDHVLVADSVYDPTRVFCRQVLAPMGVETTFFDPLIGAGISALFRDNTRVIFIESPGSLTFEVQDVPAICAVARGRGVVTMIDNTWATPLLFPAIAHGVDFTILACTKYVVGHSDVMMGSVTTTDTYWNDLRKSAQIYGQVVSPDDAALAARGLRTMGVRLQQQGDSALTVARWLQTQPKIRTLLHPAFADCPGHEIWKRDFKGASGLFSFEFTPDVTDAERCAFVDRLRLFGIGFSWGGFESLALPVDPATIRSATTWEGRGLLVRLHIGLEDPADLIADLRQSLEHVVA